MFSMTTAEILAHTGTNSRGRIFRNPNKLTAAFTKTHEQVDGECRYWARDGDGGVGDVARGEQLNKAVAQVASRCLRNTMTLLCEPTKSFPRGFLGEELDRNAMNVPKLDSWDDRNAVINWSELSSFLFNCSPNGYRRKLFELLMKRNSTASHCSMLRQKAGELHKFITTQDGMCLRYGAYRDEFCGKLIRLEDPKNLLAQCEEEAEVELGVGSDTGIFAQEEAQWQILYNRHLVATQPLLLKERKEDVGIRYLHSWQAGVEEASEISSQSMSSVTPSEYSVLTERALGGERQVGSGAEVD